MGSPPQTMTKAEHNQPIPKLFDNQPLALAAEVFFETIGLVIYIQNVPIIVSFLATKLKIILSPKLPAHRELKININSNLHMVLSKND